MKKTLFKKDSKGRIRFLTFENFGNQLHMTSGIVGTENPKLDIRTCSPKNVGKSNETTGEEQALKELESKYLRKQDSGYFTTVHEASTVEVILPMLAKDYFKEKHKIDWSKDHVFVQPKLDGMRANLHVQDTVFLISRDGKKIETLPHIIEAAQGLSYGIYDGELYIHGESFQENMKAIKKYRKGITEKVKFRTYDIILDFTFEERHKILENRIPDFHPVFETVPTHIVESEEDIIEWNKKFLRQGYEGTMIRWGVAPYKKGARSSNLLKYKQFIDLSAKIIDVIPSERKPEWGTPVLELPSDLTKTFKAGTKLSHKDRENLLSDKDSYIGKTAEIRFFEWTDSGLPRFPVMVGVRLDKTT